MQRKSILFLMLMATLAVLVACSQPAPEPVGSVNTEPAAGEEASEEEESAGTGSEEPAAEGNTIRIGGLGPLSKPGTVVGGIAMEFAMNLAVQDINEEGGVLGKQLELIFADTEGLPERGTAVARRLIQEDGVVALTGEYHSAVGLAVAEVAHEEGVPVLFSETWSDEITQTGYPEVFRIAPAATMVSKAMSDWLSAVGAETVVIIAENTDYGTNQAEADKKHLETAGLEVLDTIYVELGTQDYQPILARIQAMNPPPDVIRVAVTGEDSYNLERQISDMGLAPNENTIGIANQVAIQTEFWESVPNGAYWTFTLVGLPPSLYNDTTRRVAEAYKKEFETAPPSYALEAYDSVWILADAIERAGSTEPEALIKAIEETDMELAQGRYYFEYHSANPVPDDVPDYMWHQWPDPAVLMLQYFDKNQGPGDAAVVWPPTYQTHDTPYIPYGETP